MAPAPAASPPARKGLSLTSPGPKEYLIIGGSALGLALLYFWWKSRQAAAAGTTPAATTAAGTAAPAATTPTGLSTTEFWHWITDHQTTKTVTPAPQHPDKDGKIKVPDVVGEKYMAGSKKVRADHLIAQRGTPFVGTVRRESPHAGTKVRPGTVVTLSGKSGGGGTWPKAPGGRHTKKRHKKRKPAGK